MQDFVPLGTGNSRNLKSAVPTGTTWEQALSMLRNGTFPIDIGAVNNAGVAQKGDPLNKANLFSDETAELYPGLPENPVPDDVFAALGYSPRYTFLTEIEVTSGTVKLDITDGAFLNRVLYIEAIPDDPDTRPALIGVSIGTNTSRILTFNIGGQQVTTPTQSVFINGSLGIRSIFRVFIKTTSSGFSCCAHVFTVDPEILFLESTFSQNQVDSGQGYFGFLFRGQKNSGKIKIYVDNPENELVTNGGSV